MIDQALAGILRSVSEGRLSIRSPRIRTLTFSAQLHHLRWPLSHLVSLSCANSPSAYASYDVLVHQLADLLAASSRPCLTARPLPFTSSYRLITTWFSTVTFLQRTFTSLVNTHAGRTQGAATDLRQLSPFVQKSRTKGASYLRRLSAALAFPAIPPLVDQL